MPVLSSLAAFSAGSEAVVGTSPAEAFAGCAATAAPSSSSSVATQPETPFPVTGTNPFATGPSIDSAAPGGSTVRTSASELGPARRLASVVVPAPKGSAATAGGSEAGTGAESDVVADATGSAIGSATESSPDSDATPGAI